MMSPNQSVQTMIARDFSHTMEVSLRVHEMSLHYLQRTKVARDFSLNMKVTLMVHMMPFHSLMQTMIARDSLSMGR